MRSPRAAVRSALSANFGRFPESPLVAPDSCVDCIAVASPKSRTFTMPSSRGPVTIWARYFVDETTGAVRLEKVTDPATVDRNDPGFRALGAVTIRVARLPYGFAQGGKSK